MIPKRLHYVWVGSELPEQQKAFIATWRENNPEYELFKWDESNIDFELPQISAAYRQRQWAKVADIVRLAAVLRYGGIYLDTDFMVFKSLDPLLRHRCFYGFQYEFHETDWVANGAFGAEPDHWFVKRALGHLCAMTSGVLWLQRPTAFGPKLITRLLREEGLTAYCPEGVYVKDIFLCPVPVFYPFAMDETFTDDCIGPQTLAAHFWHNSWAASLPFPIRTARAIRLWMRSVFNRTTRLGERYIAGASKLPGGSAQAE